jgi:hypothetical protein
VKRALVIAGFVVAVLAAIAIRVVVRGRDALADGDAALAAKHTTEAIQAYESAARWYLPLASHVDEGYERLVKIAESDPKYALPAWRAVRRASLATRSLWTPHADDLARANAAIVKLSAASPDAAGAAGETEAARTAFYTNVYARDPRPSTICILLAVAGILSQLAGIAVAIRRSPRIGIALTVAGVVAWAVGLYNA